MCDTALGMACNGTYAFREPFFIWLLLGAFNVGGMSADYPPLGVAQWIGALVMILGIFIISVNPLSLFRKNKLESVKEEAGAIPRRRRGNVETMVLKDEQRPLLRNNDVFCRWRSQLRLWIDSFIERLL